MKSRLAGVILAIGAAAFVSGCARDANRASSSGPGTTTTTHAAGGGGHDAGQQAAHDMNSKGAGDSAAASSHSSAEVTFLFPDGDDKGWSKLTNGFQHTMAPVVPLASIPAPIRTQLIRQLALTAELVRKYPTAKDAEAAGYRRVGPFVPGMGTHYMGGKTNTSGTLTDEEILHPSSILYDGTSPDSPIAGFMYHHEPSGQSPKEPEGFAGPNDHWHRHTGVCLTPGSNGATEALGADGNITEADCKAKGGNYLALTPYAVHVWTVPAYTSPLGVFSHLNPALTCPDGSYHRDRRDITNLCRQGGS